MIGLRGTDPLCILVRGWGGPNSKIHLLAIIIRNLERTTNNLFPPPLKLPQARWNLHNKNYAQGIDT